MEKKKFYHLQPPVELWGTEKDTNLMISLM